MQHDASMDYYSETYKCTYIEKYNNLMYLLLFNTDKQFSK